MAARGLRGGRQRRFRIRGQPPAHGGRSPCAHRHSRLCRHARRAAARPGDLRPAGGRWLRHPDGGRDLRRPDHRAGHRDHVPLLCGLARAQRARGRVLPHVRHGARHRRRERTTARRAAGLGKPADLRDQHAHQRRGRCARVHGQRRRAAPAGQIRIRAVVRAQGLARLRRRARPAHHRRAGRRDRPVAVRFSRTGPAADGPAPGRTDGRHPPEGQVHRLPGRPVVPAGRPPGVRPRHADPPVEPKVSTGAHDARNRLRAPQ